MVVPCSASCLAIAGSCAITQRFIVLGSRSGDHSAISWVMNCAKGLTSTPPSRLRLAAQHNSGGVHFQPLVAGCEYRRVIWLDTDVINGFTGRCPAVPESFCSANDSINGSGHLETLPAGAAQCATDDGAR